jgi:FAD/FMN-containing dehydrogenase
MTATFGAGVTLAAAQEALAHHNQWLPIDGDEHAALGELVAHNSTGPLRLGYGAWRDLLLGVQFRNGRGELITAGGQTMKNVAGYDLTKFMVGQAGVFGTIETITTRTYRKPDAALLATFPPHQRTINRLFPTDARPQWALLTRDALLCGYVGDERAIAFYEQDLAKHGPTDIKRRTLREDVEHRASLWRTNADATARVSVPPVQVEEFVRSAKLDAWVADAAFGIVLTPVRNDDHATHLCKAADGVGGTVTIIRASSKPSIEFTTTPAERALLERLKRSFDPDNTLAPLPWQTTP